MKEIELYRGAMPVNAGEVRMIKLGDIGRQAAEESAQRAAGVIDVAEEAFKWVVDYGTAKKAEADLSAAREKYDMAVQQAGELESGDPRSAWREDGTLNEERMAELRKEYEEDLGRIKPTFLDARRGFETQEGIEATRAKTIERNEGHIHAMELRKARQNWQERYENAAEGGRIGEAMGLLKEGVRNGVVSAVKADTMGMRLAKRGVGGGGGVRVGGESYEEFEAQLAAGKAREASPEPAAPQEEATAEATAEGSGETVGLRLDANYWGNEGDGGDKSQDGKEREITLRPWEEWAETGECGGVIRLMNEAEYEGLQLNLAGKAEAVVRQENGLGDFHWSAGERAPEVAQVAVAGANKRGAMSKEEARTMVTGILLEKYVTYGELSEDAAAKIFEGSGVYEALGDGNENMGVAEVKGIANEVKKRAGNADMSRLDNEGIETLVDLQLDAGGWGTDKEGNLVDWARMEEIEKKLNADSGYVEDEKWDKSEQSEEGKKDWFYAYELYKKHRFEYNPKAEGKLDKDEAEEKLPGFVRWWNGKYGKRKKAVARTAHKAYMMGEVYRALQNSATATSNGTKYEQDGAFVNDVAVTRETLRRASGAPLNDAVEAYLNEQDAREKQTEATIKKWHEDAQAAKKKLNDVMEAKAQEEAEAKKREKEEAAAEKKREKEEEKAEKEADAEAERRKRVQYALARREPRAQSWTWDGVARGKSGALVCRVPESELKRIRETMGYDGTQFVILRMGDSGKSIYVDMSKAARGGAIELSSAAVKLMQERPTGRGRKRVVPAVKSSGTGDFYYEFKEIK